MSVTGQTIEDPASAGAPAADAAAVTSAILLATAPHGDRAAALLPWDGTGSVLERLAEQLRALGVRRLHVIGRPGGAGLDALAERHADVTVHVSATPAEDLQVIARIADAGWGGLLIGQAEVVVHGQALAGLIADPRVGTGALNAARRIGRPFGHRIRTRRGRVVSAGSPFHAVGAPNGTFLGLLKVAAADRARLSETASALSVLRADPPAGWRRQLEVVEPGSWKLALAAGAADEPEDEARAEVLALQADFRDEPAAGDPALEDDLPGGPRTPDEARLSDEDAAELDRRVRAAREDVVALLLVGLVRADVRVGIGQLRGFFWARPLAPVAVDEAHDRLAALDEEAILLASAVKPSDGFFTTFFVSPYSRHIARWCARRGFTPNQVTTFSMALGALAAAGFATGERWGLVGGAVLLQAAFTFDCVDGQLARYTRSFSRFGAWLDSIFDRSKEYLVYAGLAIGAAATGADPWVLAGAALALQTTRHAVDFAYPLVAQQAVAAIVHPPLEQSGDGVGSGLPRWLTGEPAPARPSRPAARGAAPRLRWAKKVLAFPIGERFAVISLTAALFDAKVTFVVLLAWGGVALAAGLASRVWRSLRARRPAPATADRRLAAMRDDGPLARLVARPRTGRLRWIDPVLLRAVELGGITWLGTLAGAGGPPAAFALSSAIAFRHYDVVYGDRQPGLVAALGGGWDGRLVLVAALVAVGAAPAGLWIAAGALGALFAGSAVHGWLTFNRAEHPLAHDDPAEETD